MSEQRSVCRTGKRMSPRRCAARRSLLTSQGLLSKVAATGKPSAIKANTFGATSTIEDQILPRGKKKRVRKGETCILPSSNAHRRKTEGQSVTPYLQTVIPDEVLLNILSFVHVKEVCHLASVCLRFCKICKDASLWERLYKRTFELNYCLRKTERGLFERLDVVTKDSWREAFAELYPSYHVYCDGLSKTGADEVNKCNGSIEKAIKSAAENSIIIIHPGVYKDVLVIDKKVTILGTGFKEQSSVTIEGTNAAVIKFVTGSANSYIYNVTLKFVGSDGLSTRPSCVEIGPDCMAIVHQCSIASRASAGSAIYVHGNNARPRIVDCLIKDSENVGIFVNNNAQGIYENNEISNSKLAGVWVKNGASPIMRNNKVHHGRDVGFFIFDNGQGYFDGNDVFSNRIAGFEVRSGGNPAVVHCKIHHGLTGGVYVHDEGRGEFIQNKIYANTFAGIWVTSRSNPTIKDNEIFSGQQGGVYIFGEGRGLIENNNIHSNALAGIQIRSNSNPIVRHNRVHHGLHGGIYVFVETPRICITAELSIRELGPSSVLIKTTDRRSCSERLNDFQKPGVYRIPCECGLVYIGETGRNLSMIFRNLHEGGLGLIEDNEIYSNTLAGVWVTTGSAPVMRNNRIHSGKQVGVYFYDNGGGILEHNEIFNHKYSGIQIRTRSNPVIRRNKIWGGQNGGVLVYNQGFGLLEDNEIFDNAMAGVWIKTESDPVLRRNKIHDGKEGGICIFNGGKGLLENNDIFRNSLTGVLISTSSFPVLRGNRIFEGGTTGVEITNGAGGILESNEIFNNKFGGICLATGVKPQLTNNILHDNKQVIKSTVDSGWCLFKISGNTCYPMHDFYRCNSCGTSESFAICVNCIKQCHRGHDVEFVRRDRFFCDCGAGSTGIQCQLLGKDQNMEQSSLEPQTMRALSVQTESRVHTRCRRDLARNSWQRDARKVVSTNERS